jgi:hypothetical protein
MKKELTARLEAALLREIAREYARLVETYFKRALSQPNIVLSENESTLGRWIPQTRTLELSRKLVLSEPWPVTIEVLKHEIAHQFVHEALHRADESAHGPSFLAVCERLGIDAKSKGLPTPSPDHDESHVAARIAKLLALAESPNAHEAEAAMLAAQRLLFKHNLEMADVRGKRGYGVRHLGKPKGRTYEPERILASILIRFFFVEAIWIPVYRPLEGLRGSVLEVCGSPTNLDIAEYVHGFLTETAERLWREHKQRNGLRSDRDRRTFLAGVMSGVSDKLGREKKRTDEQGLVWVKDGALDDFLRKRHPHIRHIRYGGERKNETYAHGRHAGRNVVIHRGVTSGPSGRTHLLKG